MNWKVLTIPRPLTRGKIVFVLLWSLCLGSVYSLVQWNAASNLPLVTTFIVLAQIIIESSPPAVGDPDHAMVLLTATVGYILLFAVSMYLWNQAISGELVGGFALFVTRVVKQFLSQP